MVGELIYLVHQANRQRSPKTMERLRGPRRMRPRDGKCERRERATYLLEGASRRGTGLTRVTMSVAKVQCR